MAKHTARKEFKRYYKKKMTAAQRLLKGGGLSFREAISKVFKDGKRFK